MSTAAASDPFESTSNPAHYVARPDSDAVLAELERRVRDSAHPVALTGPVGLGKTFLLHVAADRLVGSFRVVWVPYPALSAPELCRWVLEALGEDARAEDPEGALLDCAFRTAGDGREILMMVDDASALPLSTARQLATLVSASGGALRAVFGAVDDSRLGSVMAALGPDLHEVRYDAPMTADQTAAYVRARLERSQEAERTGRFDADTVARIHGAAAGNPRRIHELASVVWRLEPDADAAAAIDQWARDEQGRAEEPPAEPLDTEEEEAEIEVSAAAAAAAALAAEQAAPPRRTRGVQPVPEAVRAATAEPVEPEPVAEAPIAEPEPVAVSGEDTQPMEPVDPEPEVEEPAVAAAALAGAAVAANTPADEAGASPEPEAEPEADPEPATDEEDSFPALRDVGAVAASEAASEEAPAPAETVEETPEPEPPPIAEPAAASGAPLRDRRRSRTRTAWLAVAGLGVLAVAMPYLLRGIDGLLPGEAERPKVPIGPAAVVDDSVAEAPGDPPEFVEAPEPEAAPAEGSATASPDSEIPARAESPEPEAATPTVARRPAPEPTPAQAPRTEPPPRDEPEVPVRRSEPTRSATPSAPPAPAVEPRPARSPFTPPENVTTPRPAPSETARAPSPAPRSATAPPSPAPPETTASPRPAPSTRTRVPTSATAPAPVVAATPAPPRPVAPAPEPTPEPEPAPVRATPAPTAAAPQPPPEPAPRTAAVRPAPAPSAAAADTVRVNIHAIPWAKILIDGKTAGETPLIGYELSPGLHVFRAEFPGGRAVVRTVEVSAENRHISFE